MASKEAPIAPEDAEKNLVNEDNKAGAEAYQFNPDATPEQKAAAAESRLPPGFHHKHKPKGTAVISDADGGPDQYDLPPPPKDADAILAEEAAESAEKHEQAVPEDLRWARDRTGWEPRFEIQKDDKDDEPNLLDHQTWLDGKLPDKIFGDWYHNAAVIIFACLFSWLVAFFGGGIAWVILIMAFCSTYYRTSNRRVRRNFRDDINREMSKQRLETDTESLEWINSFMVKFWPIYAPVICDTVINSVDQVLSTNTPAFLDNLRLKTFVLGTKPPRLEHVKTYPKTQPDVLIMDWKFSFTPNDVADMTARQLKDKINPKLVLEVRVGKAMVSKGLDVIVEDMACSGLMRVKIKFQIPFPHIERVDVCFLEEPYIDYVCKPLGGDTLGFDINFIPGLEGFIKDQIHANLGPMMYDPNVFPVEVAKMLAGNAVDRAIGVVAVTLHGARSLKNPDKFAGTPDPYAVVSLNNTVEIGRTKTVTGNESPRWGETIYVIVSSFTDTLTIQPYDFNEYRKDKELGSASFALDRLEEEPEHESLNLEVMSSGRSRGAIHADIRFFPVMEGRELEDGSVEPPPEMNTGIARFTVEQAKELDSSKSMVGQLSPYAALLLNGKEIHATKKLKRTNNPIFQDASKEFLITDRKTARLGTVIKDDRDFANDPIIGSYQIKLNDLLKLKEKGQEWFHLHGAKCGRVKLTLDWKPVSIGGISGSAGYVDPIGVMRFHFKSATGLRNMEALGQSDPYARVMLSGVMKGRTVTFRSDLNPKWDEVIYVPIRNTKERIALEVMDEESSGSDRSLGWVDVAATDYIRETADGGYEIDEEKQLMSRMLHSGRGQGKGTLNYTAAFYPTMSVVNPEDEVEEEETEAAVNGDASSEVRKSTDSKPKVQHSKSASNAYNASVNGVNGRDRATSGASKLTNGSRPGTASTIKEIPRTFISADDLTKHPSGFFVFKLHECQLSRAHAQLEVLIDDYMFPNYVSPKLSSKSAKIEDIGDAFVRELEYSKITLRLVQKSNPKDSSEGNTVAKLTGDTLPTLQRILYTPTELVLRSTSGEVSKVTVSARYIPAYMKLDPKESINNMGDLRVDILDAAELPSADRNGYSDPYCRFQMDGEDVHKTKVQKKTLHPAWNEFFQTPVKSRIGADFRVKVYDWDFGNNADLLGTALIDLEQLEPFEPMEVTVALDGKSGVVRLKMLFKPSYVIRERQGSSTFSGAFDVPGKVVGAPVKGVGFVGGHFLKGASSLRRGVMSRLHRDHDGASVHSTEGMAEDAEMTKSANVASGMHHSRSQSNMSQTSFRGTPGKGEGGTATITIVSASGYSSASNLRVVIKALGSKGAKEVHKTKAVKPSDGAAQFDPSHETCKVSRTTADAQYQLRVVDHSTFGSDNVLGEALYFVDDQGSVAGQDKPVSVGEGTVTVRSSFAGSENQLRPVTSQSNADAASEMQDSPASGKLHRRSLLSRRSVSGA